MDRALLVQADSTGMRAAHPEPGGPAPSSPRRGPSALAIEIAVVLALKAVALTFIWWAFFSAPVAPSMRLEPAAVDRQVFHPPPPEQRDAERNGR